MNSARDKGLISPFYNHLNNLTLQDKSGPMLQWETELDCTLSVETWHSMVDNLRKSNRAISFKETPVKLFSRWYFTPSRIYAFYPSTSPNCFRGCPEQGTFLHTFWSCKLLDKIWRAAVDRFEESSKLKIGQSIVVTGTGQIGDSETL